MLVRCSAMIEMMLEMYVYGENKCVVSDAVHAVYASCARDTKERYRSPREDLEAKSGAGLRKRRCKIIIGGRRPR